MLSSAFYLLTYDRYLPLLDYSDESNMFLLSVHMRGIDEVALADDYGAGLTGEWLAGYPPLYPWLGVWMQRLQDATTNTFLFPARLYRRDAIALCWRKYFDDDGVVVAWLEYYAPVGRCSSGVGGLVYRAALCDFATDY